MGTSDETNDKRDSSQDITLQIPAPACTEPANIHLEFAAQTHIGNVRPNNEDQFLIARASKSLDILATSLPPEQLTDIADLESHFLMVADGMGGHAGGEIASAYVIDRAVHHLMKTAKWFFKLDDPDENVRLRLLREALERADRTLIAEAKRDPKLTGMGTTLTALSILGADVFLVHVGDSRAYLLRKGKLEQLTRDHTRAQDLVEQGLLLPEEARTSRLRHVLTNVLGGVPGVEGELLKFRLLDGDRLLLCTDGLSDLVRDNRISEILQQSPNPETACRLLVEAALSEGGRDNITVVVAACSIPEA